MAKRANLTTPDPHYNVLIYGEPGTGKTTIGATAPEPLVLLSEENGLAHLRKAELLHKRRVAGVIVIEEFSDFRHVLREIHRSDRSKPLTIPGTNKGDEPLYQGPWPRSIVVDQLTDVVRLCGDEIRALTARSKDGGKRTDRDGLPKDVDGYWRVFIERMTGLIVTLRDLPFHTIFLSHAKIQKVKPRNRSEPETTTIRPHLPTEDLPRLLVGAVNVVGVTYRRIHKGRPQWGVATITSDSTMSKPLPPLRARENTDLSDWFRRLREDAALGDGGATQIEGFALEPDDETFGDDGDRDDLDLPQGDKATDREAAPKDDDGTDDDGAEGYFAATSSDADDAPGDW
jgi:hypothetical protein